MEATLFHGTTRLGREVRLQLPVKSFHHHATGAGSLGGIQPPRRLPAKAKFEEREVPVWLPWALGGGGVLLLLLGAGGFILLQKRRTCTKAMAAQKAQQSEPAPAPQAGSQSAGAIVRQCIRI